MARGWGRRRRMCAPWGGPDPRLGHQGPVFSSSMLISLQLWPGRQVCSDGFDYRGQHSCVWWARPSPRPRPLLPPSLGLRFVICSRRAPCIGLWLPVLNLIQISPVRYFPAHTLTPLPPALLRTLSGGRWQRGREQSRVNRCWL